jgi:two-component system response regulator YesN
LNKQLYNILIVEDEDNIRMGIENNNDWEGLGLKVVGSVSNGLEAFEFLSNNIVHVTLADIRMPKMDGLELMRQCKMIKLNTYFVFLI